MTLNVPEILKNTNTTPHAPDISSGAVICADDMPEACGDDGHNSKEDKNNNINRIDDNCAASENNSEWTIPDRAKQLLVEVGIDYRKNSEDAIRKVIGEAVNYRIIERIITKHKNEFYRGKARGNSYSFGILMKIIEAEYKKEVAKEHAEEAFRQHEREESRKRREYEKAVHAGLWRSESAYERQRKESSGLTDEQFLRILDEI